MIYSCVATDCVGNTATTSHAIHVFDKTAPVIIGVGPDVTVEYQKVPLHKYAKIGVSVTDNSDSDDDDYNEITLHLEKDITIPGYDVNSYTIIRNYWAKDDCGNKVEVHRTIVVVDKTPPCFDEEPGDTTVECDAIPSPCVVYTVGVGYSCCGRSSETAKAHRG
eukprot:TRINITY_DN1012_c0_g1_i2.p1 TRINITY_DN1012_c0_g1~~TRINITY_DN1012_c0_g1_i2.p1  ORF type:complete len:164 (+),score=65.15 TRINITY_DN1012_c0_g1_i2:336-827(+)